MILSCILQIQIEGTHPLFFIKQIIHSDISLGTEGFTIGIQQ